jgi:hypothetical protein
MARPDRVNASRSDERRDALEASLKRARLGPLPMLPLVRTSRLAARRTGMAP